VVPLEGEPSAAVARLAGAGIEAKAVGQGTEAVRLGAGEDPVRALDALPCVVQDPGANLVVRYADPAPGTNVADLCAAPGGKALALSGRVLYTLAADRSEVRLGLVRENARRTGRRLGLVVADAGHPPIRELDMVLLDVPCTGTGTLARHPDARWRLDSSSPAELAAVQERLLEGAADSVRPGGLLVYSTCTLEPEENEEQVNAFLARRPDFRIEATGAVPAEYTDERGQLVILPQRTAFDGAFAARMRRRG
jgi:16S rRNA (cytosine967-C5)-methyltransferase